MKRKSYAERKSHNEEIAKKWCEEFGFDFIRMILDDHFYFFDSHEGFGGFRYGHISPNGLIRTFV